MKRYSEVLTVTVIIVLSVALNSAMAQPPSPDNQSNGGNVGGTPITTNGAPIGTGIALMTGLFAAFGAKKAWDAREKLGE
jgi:hypothetical protein